MIKHTPGPWTIDTGETDEYVIREPQGEAIAVVCDSVIGEHSPNAYLIAAAPDLLNALQKIASACTENEKNEFMGEGWRKAHEKIGAFARAVLSRFEEGT